MGLINGCDPTLGQSFEIITFASRSNDFATVSGITGQLTCQAGAANAILTGL